MKLKNIVAALALLAAVSGNAFAGSTSGTIPIGTTITAGCILGTTGASINVGSFTAAALRAASSTLATGSLSVQVQCTSGTAWSLAYAAQDDLTSAGIAIYFYNNAGMTTTDPVTGVGNDLPQNANLYYKAKTYGAMVSTLGTFSINKTVTLTW